MPYTGGKSATILDPQFGYDYTNIYAGLELGYGDILKRKMVLDK